jgi:hypothetical protein
MVTPKTNFHYICVDRGRQFLECYEAERDYSDDMKHHCLTAQWHGFLSH